MSRGFPGAFPALLAAGLVTATVCAAGSPPARAMSGTAAALSRAARASRGKAAPTPKLPSGYAQWRSQTHAADPDAPRPMTGDGRPMLVLESLNGGDRVELTPASDDGGFSASDLDRAASAMHDTRAGNEHPVDPRLLDLVYRIQRHFDAPAIRFVSAYRTPTPTKGARSYHGRGRAMDIVVPGASDDDVATFARGFGFVGVGVYPVSGFVHVDSRPRSFFWVDRSGPGQRNRTMAVLGNVAADADRQAAARGERAPTPWAPPGGDADLVVEQHDDGDAEDD